MTSAPAPVAVVGASGKTGRHVADALDARGVPVRRLGRAELADPVGAFTGTAAAYLIAPNLHPDEPSLVAGWLDALRTAGVPRVAYHSVAWPYAPAMPHHLAKAVTEDLVRRSGLAWTVLQPCAYVQNLLPGLAGDTPEVRVPYSVSTPLGLVDLTDVGEAAAVVLTEDGHVGATYELGGPALVTLADVAAAASEVLEVPVVAERLDPDAWADGLGAAMVPRERDWLRAMFAFYDAYGLPAGGLPLRALLGRTPHDVASVLRRELRGLGSVREA
ncbi:nmra family transcriptional regulator [Mumia zhuanghuii]|uniref:SDR family oxidoreductase n=2 Tax=Mumia TaxID=1546255 RepID=A0ABW1QHH8_9ACTN|nr:MULTISPECIES: NmrA family NAD(P)-binding protein [Mumia]KAA1422627.1 nmra family transcriptional regulator [Mumia zhuanghuii]